MHQHLLKRSLSSSDAAIGLLRRKRSEYIRLRRSNQAIRLNSSVESLNGSRSFGVNQSIEAEKSLNFINLQVQT